MTSVLLTLLLLATDAASRPPYSAIAVSELPRTTQFRSAHARAIAKAGAQLTTRVLARDAVDAVVGPDGTSLFVANRGRGSRIVTLATNERWRLPASYVHAAAFSPTGARLAVIDEDQSLLIYSLTDGKLERRLTGPFVALGFVSPNLLALYDGCTLSRVDVTTDHRLEPLAPTPCGEAEHTADSRTWLVSERLPGSTEPSPGIRALYLVDAERGATSLLVIASAEDPIASARLVSERFVCFTRRPTPVSEPALYCADTTNRVARLVREGPIHRLVADDGQAQLAFTDLPHAPSTALYVANLDTWSIQSLGPTAASGFRFLPGGRRLAAWQTPLGGATLYDLASAWQLQVVRAEEGVSAVISIPGSDRRLLVARRRGNASELVDVEGLPE